MKIHYVEINNYKAFYGRQSFDIKGKNVFIYGENDSGKSSFYYALKDFFQSAMETIDLAAVENIFIKATKRGQSYIKVGFKPDSTGNRAGKTYELTSRSKTTNAAGDTSISDANSLKSFLTYKHLLAIHHIKGDAEINLFDLLVLGVLKHFKYALTNGKELGELWQDVLDAMATETNRAFNIIQKKNAVISALQSFDRAFEQLFIVPTHGRPNPEYLLNHAKPILQYFDQNIDILFTYTKGVLNPANDGFVHNKEPKVNVALTYAGQVIPKPYLFLNEARLSAIALSVYLGMIKRHPQLKPYKILFLIDVFIGLDISNRLPLLQIMEDLFADYQVFITTYDRPWYEYVNSFLQNNNAWMTMEFYAKMTNKGYELPMIMDKTDYLAKAQLHLANSDYKSAAVYTRTAFEQIVQKFCDNKIKVKYHQQAKKYTSDDFWTALKAWDATQNPPKLTPAIIVAVEAYRDLVLNAFSHYDIEKHRIRRELIGAIGVIGNLKGILR